MDTNQKAVDEFKAFQEEIGWSNSETAEYLARSISTVEAWRSGKTRVDPLALKAMRFAANYARHIKSKRLGPNDLNRI